MSLVSILSKTFIGDSTLSYAILKKNLAIFLYMKSNPTIYSWMELIQFDVKKLLNNKQGFTKLESIGWKSRG